MKNRSSYGSLFSLTLICLTLICLTLALRVAAEHQDSVPSRVLVSYSFDDSKLAIDNNSLFFFNNARGHVGLSNEFALSGYNAIELKEEPFDTEFTELQGRFTPQAGGVLRFHFAILVENPEEELNIAVAGPEHFRVKKDGIAFWLHTQKGVLIHETDGIPRKLFSLTPFTWYFFDIVYDIDHGRYDLIVRAEGSSRETISLRDQPNAANNPRSAVDRFSFIGDLGDRSKVHYFIDDVILTEHPSIEAARSAVRSDNQDSLQRSSKQKTPHHEDKGGTATKPSGHSTHRTRLGYLDGSLEVQMLLRQKLRCIPATRPEDLGVDGSTLASAVESFAGETLEERLGNAVASATNNHDLAGTKIWVAGCKLLAEQKIPEAIEQFRSALNIQPNTPLYRAALALALSARGDHNGASQTLLQIESEWRVDPRLPALKAYLQAAKGEFDAARASLTNVANQLKQFPDTHIVGNFLAGDTSDTLLNALKRDYPHDWHKRLDDLLIAQNYYYTLLWNGKFIEAEQYAHALAETLKVQKVSELTWLEREGDAAYFAGKPKVALKLYRTILSRDNSRRTVWRKLLDVAHKGADTQVKMEARRSFAQQRFTK